MCFEIFQRKKSGVLGLMFFFILLGMIIIIVYRLIIWMTDFSNSLPLSQLTITGKRFYTTDYDIQKSVLNICSFGTFMKQDISVIQKNIQSFSWIKQVSVRKQWPDKIKIHIIEYVPIARWNNLYMITKDATIFDIPEEINIHRKLFPLLFGPDGSEKRVLNSYYDFRKIVDSCAFQIKSVSMNHRYSYEVVLQDNIKLILGRKNNIERLQRFITIYPIFRKQYMNIKYKHISCIDLRYKSGFAVKKY